MKLKIIDYGINRYIECKPINGRIFWTEPSCEDDWNYTEDTTYWDFIKWWIDNNCEVFLQ